MSDELLTVVGTNGGITEKANGWFEVAVNLPGKTYPVKVATKKSILIDAVRAVGEGIATFSYKEMESDKINPHTNVPYKNRYLEGVEPGGNAASNSVTAGGKGGGSDAMTKEEWNAKERRDFRSRAWAHTISAMHHTIAVDEDPAHIFARLKTLQTLVYRDIVRELEGEQSEDMTAAATGGDDYDRPPDYSDDDIPF